MGRVSRRRQCGRNGYVGVRQGDWRKEELADRFLKLRERGNRIDPRAKMRAVVEAFGVVRSKGAELVDHPFVVTDRGGTLAHTFAKQEVDVVEQELPAIGRTDRAWGTARLEVGGLGKDPRVP